VSVSEERESTISACRTTPAAPRRDGQARPMVVVTAATAVLVVLLCVRNGSVQHAPV